MTTILFWLMVSHAVCDYPLQGDSMAYGKGDFRKHFLGVPWYYWLAAHALIHAGGVALATGVVLLGVYEFIAHCMIDFGKCRKWYGIHVDQTLHVACKVAWATAALNGEL